MLGTKLADLGFKTGLVPAGDTVHVKAPIFSFTKLPLVDSSLGPEMKSTGEVMGSDVTLPKALYKAFVASNIKVPKYGNVLFTVADDDKTESLALAKRFRSLGFQVFATAGTASAFTTDGLDVMTIDKLGDSEFNAVTALRNRQLQIVVNTMDASRRTAADGSEIRAAAIENAVPLFTALDTVSAFLQVLEDQAFNVSAL